MCINNIEKQWPATSNQFTSLIIYWLSILGPHLMSYQFLFPFSMYCFFFFTLSFVVVYSDIRNVNWKSSTHNWKKGNTKWHFTYSKIEVILIEIEWKVKWERRRRQQRIGQVKKKQNRKRNKNETHRIEMIEWMELDYEFKWMWMLRPIKLNEISFWFWYRREWDTCF